MLDVILIILAIILFFVITHLICTAIAAYCVYDATLTLKNKEKWGRVVSVQEVPQIQMDEEGMQWHYQNKDHKIDVHITRDGLNLYGEYYDFGFDKAVMVLSGRTESLRYGYYFAIPYAKAGFNVLVVDPRAHGYSDGKYNTVGFEESKDAIAWVNYISKEFNVQSFVLHGICIGAAGGMLAITSSECPECVKVLVTEGMFPKFWESMKNNLIERKRMFFPILQFIDLWMRLKTGHSMKKGPIDFISKMDKPLLMLQSKVDKYSLSQNAEKMFAMCPSDEKRLVLFESGDHSLLRFTHTEKYDSEITNFLKRVF